MGQFTFKPPYGTAINEREQLEVINITAANNQYTVVPSWLKGVDVPSKESSKLEAIKKAAAAVAASAIVRSAELLSSPAQPSPLHCR